MSGSITSARVFDLRLAALVLETGVDGFVTYNTRDFSNILYSLSVTPDVILKVFKDRE